MSANGAGPTTLNDCGCCEGLTARTPLEIYNRGGLSALAYRVGDHAHFKESLLARLSSFDFPRLSGLRSRDDDDFTIALLDAWAMTADVLAFYQERIANEAYLRTASERLSLLELTRLLGYQLRPGVAASTYLAFTMDEAPGSPEASVQMMTVPTGTKVQSTPGPDEQAQMFETVEQIEARIAWNEMRPRRSQAQAIDTAMGSVVAWGAALQLKTGDDLLVLAGASDGAVKRIMQLSIDRDAETTRIDFDSPELSPADYTRPSLTEGSPEDFAPKTDLTQAVVEDIVGKTWEVEDLLVLAEMQEWDVDTLAADINRVLAGAAASGGAGIYAFEQRASLFGYNAARLVTYDSETNNPLPASQWNEWDPANESDDVVHLDNAYSEVVPDGYIVIDKPEEASEFFRVDQVRTQPRTEYGVSGKTTRITLPSGETWWDSGSDGFGVIRSTSVLAQSRKLELARVPIEEPVANDTVVLDRAYLNLRKGQTVVVTGEPVDRSGESRSEVMTLDEVWIEGGYTVLVFEEALENIYDRDTVTVNANVALATHGETVEEILGNGDAGKASQVFELRQTPLTYVSADTPSGTESTLEVRVDDVLWHEVPSFFGHGPDERIFVTKTGDDGKTTLQFGDGIAGARLPSGQNNVRATYRKGAGLEGLVDARRLDQLMSRPLGLKSAINPLPTEGADEAESRADARRNAPLTVLTLDRTVSLQDYEDFTRSFAGIAKAQAVRIWDGNAQRVFITVAGPDGEAVSSTGVTYENLLEALEDAGDPYANFSIKSYRPAFFRLEAGIHVDPDYTNDKVLSEIRQRLRSGFAFDQRHFAQTVTLSEVITVMQGVPGVIAVDVDALYRSDNPAAVPTPILNASPAVQDGGDEILSAELLTLDPAPLDDLKVLS